MDYSIFYYEKSRGYALKESSGIMNPSSVVRSFTANSYLDAIGLSYEINNEIKKSNRIPVMIINALEEPIYTSIYNTLDEFNRIVSGTIDIVSNYDFNKFDIICNDSGKFNKLQLSRALTQNNKIYDIIAGTFIVSKSDSNGVMIGLNNLEIDEIHRYYYYPELFHMSKDESFVSVVKLSTQMGKLMIQNLVSNLSILS